MNDIHKIWNTLNTNSMADILMTNHQPEPTVPEPTEPRSIPETLKNIELLNSARLVMTSIKSHLSDINDDIESEDHVYSYSLNDEITDQLADLRNEVSSLTAFMSNIITRAI